jgi:hypothetical protein
MVVGGPTEVSGLPLDDPQVQACEAQLRRAGLPLLMEDYSAAEDIFTRAVPFLTLVVLVEVLGTINTHWGSGANTLAVLGALALLVGSFGVFNRLRKRPTFALPARVTRYELAMVVVLPALLPLVFGGRFGKSLVIALINLVIIGLVWLVVGVGLFSIVRWAAARLYSQLAASLTLLARALPLILFFGLISFFSAEIWQMFSTVPTARYLTAVVMFVALGLLFLLIRLGQQVSEVVATVDLAGVPLRPWQRLNLGLVILVSQVLQILLVTALVWLFFAVAGALLVDWTTIEAWIGADAHKLFEVGLFDTKVTVTRELLDTATGIAAFSGLYYTVGMLVDATYRDEFMDELTDQIRASFKVRTKYLRLLGLAPAAATGPTE